MLRIGVFSDSHQIYDGVTRFYDELLKASEGSELHFTFNHYYPGSSYSVNELHDNARIVAWPYTAIAIPVYKADGVVRVDCGDILKDRNLEQEYDIYHVPTAGSLGLLGRKRAMQKGKPLVSVWHSNIDGFAKLWLGRTFPLVKPGLAVLVNWFYKPFDHMFVSQDSPQLPSSFSGTTSRVNYGCDKDLFYAGNEEGDWITYAGRLTPDKNISWIVDLAKETNLFVQIIGDGSSRSAIRDTLSSEIDSGRVRVPGIVVGDDLCDAYRSSMLYVSAGENETYGLSIQEALSCNLPCVTVCKGAASERVEHGKSGLLSSNKLEFIDNVISLANDSARRSRMREYIARSVHIPTWSEVIEQMVEGYGCLSNKLRNSG